MGSWRAGLRGSPSCADRARTRRPGREPTAGTPGPAATRIPNSCFPESYRVLVSNYMENGSLNFGPIDALLRDETVTEIMVNRYDKVFVERDGKLSESRQNVFPTEQLL